MSSTCSRLYLRRAPENFLNARQLLDVRAGRRGLLAGALAAAAAGVSSATSTAATAQDRPPASSAGAPNILTLPEYSKSLGLPVAAQGCGLPSEWEKNLQRRESPGLTWLRHDAHHPHESPDER